MGIAGKDLRSLIQQTKTSIFVWSNHHKIQFSTLTSGKWSDSKKTTIEWNITEATHYSTEKRQSHSISLKDKNWEKHGKKLSRKVRAENPLRFKTNPSGRFFSHGKYRRTCQTRWRDSKLCASNATTKSSSIKIDQINNAFDHRILQLEDSWPPRILTTWPQVLPQLDHNYNYNCLSAIKNMFQPTPHLQDSQQILASNKKQLFGFHQPI